MGLDMLVRAGNHKMLCFSCWNANCGCSCIDQEEEAISAVLLSYEQDAEKAVC